MIKKRVAEAINEQINTEFYSAFLYLSMSAYFESMNLNGFAHWMNIQFQKEQAHALKLFTYLGERGGAVELETIEKPKKEWNDIIDVFQDTLDHEQLISGKINELMDIALSESDHATTSFLKWYIDEQVEEESNVSHILNQLKIIGGIGNGILMLDREMQQRVFIPPTV